MVGRMYSVDIDAAIDAYHLDGSLCMVRGSCRDEGEVDVDQAQLTAPAVSLHELAHITLALPSKSSLCRTPTVTAVAASTFFVGLLYLDFLPSLLPSQNFFPRQKLTSAE